MPVSEDVRPVAIVSGAARGIGASVVERFVAAGWSVVGVDLDTGESDGAWVAGDVTSEDTWQRALALAEDLGPLRVVVNNAGAQGVGGRIADTEVEDFDRVIDVNVRSAFLGTRLALRHAVPGGAVVNVASNAGLRGIPRFGPYAAAKHAVIGLTRTAALEGARKQLRVNAVAPGPTDTRIMQAVARSFDADSPETAMARMTRANPMGRFAQVEEISAAITWLAGPDSAYVNGCVLSVDGGLTAA
jgi:NAD(P)-dependent dehydrogenase (short-subunit alcohol dehydrogenase family)